MAMVAFSKRISSDSAATTSLRAVTSDWSWQTTASCTARENAGQANGFGLLTRSSKWLRYTPTQ